jgi:PKHD-type hydroxylase
MPSHPIQVFKTKVFTEEQCSSIIRDLANVPVIPGETMDAGRSWLHRRCSIQWISRQTSLNYIFNPVLDAMTEAAAFFGFQFDRMQPLQYTTYKPLGFYMSHVDNGHNEESVLKRKLTLSINLSPPKSYLGGGLSVRTNDCHQTDKTQGLATVFPSFLWHRANPVFLGKRRALVAWGIGEESFK